MQFRVLGPLEVDAGDGALPLGGPKQRAVLANLLVRANEVVPADTLIEDIWGDEPPGQARNTLQTYVSNLRKSLGGSVLQRRAPGYVLVVDPVAVDATRFDELVREARKSLAIDPKVAIATFEDALAMWRGPALADVAERSLLAEAARLDELRLEAQEERIGALLATGSAPTAIAELEPLLAHHPLRERLWEQLMLALYRDGRQAEALGAFQRAREILADELGIDPSPELVRLQAQILAQDSTLELRGEPLRGYRLLEKVGGTRYGVRFRAIQPRVGRDVVVEVLHEHVANAQTFVERFEAEAQAVASLEHPHIVPIYDYWREPGRAYLVWRYVRGPSLRALVERGEVFEPDRALLLVEQVASALALAHRQHVTHGDVDDEHVVFDSEGNAYLGGFAIGVGPPATEEDDVRRFEVMVRRLLGRDLPGQLAVLVDGPDARPAGAEAFVDAARLALTSRSLPAAAASQDESAQNPYRGLRPFTEADAPDFYGRSAAVRQIIDRLAGAGPDDRFVAVVGPSGCGKSSLVRAGVVPALRDGALGEPVLVTELSPGSHPYDELEAALGRVAVRLVRRGTDVLRGSSRGLLEVVDLAIPGDTDVVIVIDQFEELFTMTAHEGERRDFLECIRVACADPDSRIRVIATLRADFYDRPLVYPRFGDLLARCTEAIAPLQADELEQAIRGPAERVGVRSEPGLIAAIIADAANQPGALPLVQFTLTESFDRREDGFMTVATYRTLGGIVGSLSASADGVVRQAESDERAAIRQIFLRLVALGEGRSDTRRRVTRSALDSLDIEDVTIDRVLDTFGRLRILTFDREPATREPTVEIAHEALLDAWPRLRRWIDDAREDLRQERVLARVAGEWGAAERDPSFLLRGARLEQAAAWVRSTDLVLGQDVRRYVVASTAERTKEQDADERRRVRETEVERRSARRLRALVAVFAAAALVAGSLTLVATDQGRRAEREAAVSTVRELAAASVARRGDDPELAVLLAIEALERSRVTTGAPIAEAEEALHLAIAASRIVATIPGLGGSVATSGDGRMAAARMDHPGEVAVLDSSGTITLTIEAHRGEVTDVALTPDGSRVVTSGADGWLRAWDAEGGELLWRIHRTGTSSNVSLDGRDRLVSAVWQEAHRIVVVNAASGRVVRSFHCSLESSCLAAMSPDGSQIAVAAAHRSRSGIEAGWIGPISAEARRTRFRAPPWAGINGALSWSPDGAYLSGSSFVWDATTGELLHTAEHGVVVGSSSWSPDGTRLVTGAGASAKVWDVGSNEFRSTVSLSAGGGGSVTDVAFAANGAQVVTAAADAVRIWDVRSLGNEEGAGLSLPSIYTGALMFDPRGLLVVASDISQHVGDVFSWDPDETAPTSLALRRKLAYPSLDVNPVDGSVVLVNHDDSVTLSAGDMRQLPIVAGHALWAPDGAHLVITPTKRSVALVGLDGQEVWRAAQPEPIGTLEVSVDGRIAITFADEGGADRLVVLNGADGSTVSTLMIPIHVSALTFDPRGERVVIDSEESGPLQTWDLASGELVGTYAIETTGEPGFAFSPDGTTLGVMQADQQEVRLYDTDTRELRLVLPAPDDLLGDGPGRADGDPRCFAQGVAFNGDGTLLASHGCAGVRIFALDVDELLAIARANVTRSLTADECRRYLHGDCPPS